jgi:signal transduction histidine kinase
MSLRLRLYLVAVGLTALALLALHPPPAMAALGWHYVGWTVICLVSELLWLSTLSGEGTVSMASTAGLATLVLWGTEASMWVVSASTLVAMLFAQRKPWVRAVFNAAQSVITMWVAGVAFEQLGGPARGIAAAPAMFAGIGAARLIAPVLALFAVYLVVNRGLVAVAVAWSTDRAYLRVLREDWFYRQRLLDDFASFLLTPLVVISYLAVGYAGVLLFYAPLRMTYESQKRYVELRNAQNLLIHTERMAAKGEMAAEIGHELRNQLTAISGQAQLLMLDSQRPAAESVTRRAQIIFDQSKRMETLAQGLMDFSSAELKIERVDVNALVQRSTEFVRSQNTFDAVEWEMCLGEVPELRADPGQLQQVLFNLFLNAGDAMRDGVTPAKKITVSTRLDDKTQRVLIVVTDNGPGVPPLLVRKIFEPHFTTKPEGHGFGLSTSHRILANHGGTITVDSPPGKGASFTLSLPVDRGGPWS